MILSWARLSVVAPMRLAGTCSRYSKSAIPQLTSAATYQALVCMFFRWPYHAKVMNTLEAVSSSAVCIHTGIELRADWSQAGMGGVEGGAVVERVRGEQRRAVSAVVGTRSIAWSASAGSSAATAPRPGMLAAGAISASGSSAKARSCMRGCGTCRPGSSIIASPCSSRSRSIVRGAMWKSRRRPASCSIASRASSSARRRAWCRARSPR